MVNADLIKILEILEKNKKCSECPFDGTCEALIDSYEKNICQVLELELLSMGIE